jgi:hypothetical protein
LKLWSSRDGRWGLSCKGLHGVVVEGDVAAVAAVGSREAVATAIAAGPKLLFNLLLLLSLLQLPPLLSSKYLQPVLRFQAGGGAGSRSSWMEGEQRLAYVQGITPQEPWYRDGLFSSLVVLRAAARPRLLL